VSQITKSPPASAGRPAPQYLSAEHVVAEMADHGTRRLQRLSVAQILVLAMLAGGFVTVGALFSVLLATGIGSLGVQRLMEGLGLAGSRLDRGLGALRLRLQGIREFIYDVCAEGTITGRIVPVSRKRGRTLGRPISASWPQSVAGPPGPDGRCLSAGAPALLSRS